MFRWLGELAGSVFGLDSYSARFMAIGQVFADSFWDAYDESSRDGSLYLPPPTKQVHRSARAAVFFEDD